MSNKPFSQACENNKQPILDVISQTFSQSTKILEIGSGSGQHAVFFAKNLAHLQWQPSDVAAHLAGIQLWLDEAQLNNISAPKCVDMDDLQADLVSELQSADIDGVFTANTFHIMSWLQVYDCVQLVSKVLPEEGVSCVYGPFNYNGQYTSESNQKFDAWLQERDSLSGIRNFADVIDLSLQFNLHLQQDIAMPANNRLLIFKKQT